MRLKLFGFAIILAAVGCAHLVIDTSMPAVAAGDFTLPTGCEAVPGRGMDICRVKEGAKIDSVWRLIVPVGSNSFLKGELTVFYRDISKTYPLTQPLVEIPWKDFFAADTWSKDFDGEALALAQIHWKTPEGIEEVWTARGIAKLVVTAQGYDPLPMDSNLGTWGTNCKFQFSTAGRSAVECH